MPFIFFVFEVSGFAFGPEVLQILNLACFVSKKHMEKTYTGWPFVASRIHDKGSEFLSESGRSGSVTLVTKVKSSHVPSNPRPKLDFLPNPW